MPRLYLGKKIYFDKKDYYTYNETINNTYRITYLGCEALRGSSFLNASSKFLTSNKDLSLVLNKDGEVHGSKINKNEIKFNVVDEKLGYIEHENEDNNSNNQITDQILIPMDQLVSMLKQVSEIKNKEADEMIQESRNKLVSSG